MTIIESNNCDIQFALYKKPQLLYKMYFNNFHIQIYTM